MIGSWAFAGMSSARNFSGNRRETRLVGDGRFFFFLLIRVLASKFHWQKFHRRTIYSRWFFMREAWFARDSLTFRRGRRDCVARKKRKLRARDESKKIHGKSMKEPVFSQNESGISETIHRDVMTWTDNYVAHGDARSELPHARWRSHRRFF